MIAGIFMELNPISISVANLSKNPMQLADLSRTYGYF